jgi:hypothetical protein
MLRALRALVAFLLVTLCLAHEHGNHTHKEADNGNSQSTAMFLSLTFLIGVTVTFEKLKATNNETSTLDDSKLHL